MTHRALTVAAALVLAAYAVPAQDAPQLFYVVREQVQGQEAVTIYGADVHGANARKVRSLSSALDLSWSPNGRYLAFTQERGTDDAARAALFVVDCLSGETVTVTERQHRLLAFWWSDLSDRIFYASGDPESLAYDLYTHTLEPGGQPQALTTDALKALLSPPIVSADGRYAAFAAAGEENARQVAVADLAAPEPRIATAGLFVERHQWSLTGHRLAMVAKDSEEGTPRLYTVEPGSEPRRVSLEDQAVVGFQWQPEGEALAYMVAVRAVGGPEADGRPVAPGRVWLYTIENAAAQPQLVAGLSNVAQFEWSPTGAHYLLTDLARTVGGVEAASLRVGALAGALRAPVLVRSSMHAVRPSWSPDGKTIVYMRGDTVYSFSVETQQTSLLVNALTVRAKVWSPDSRHMAILTPYREGGVGVWQVDVAEKTGRPISNAFQGGGIDWSPDGSRVLVYILRSEEAGDVYLLDPAAEEFPDEEDAVARDVLSASWYPKS